MKERRSPIAAMIDAACGVKWEPPAPRELTPEEREMAARVAREVIDHIDTMYPKMWDGVAKSARTSVRNTVINQVLLGLKEL